MRQSQRTLLGAAKWSHFGFRALVTRNRGYFRNRLRRYPHLPFLKAAAEFRAKFRSKEGTEEETKKDQEIKYTGRVINRNQTRKWRKKKKESTMRRETLHVYIEERTHCFRSDVPPGRSCNLEVDILYFTLHSLARLNRNMSWYREKNIGQWHKWMNHARHVSPGDTYPETQFTQLQRATRWSNVISH